MHSPTSLGLISSSLVFGKIMFLLRRTRPSPTVSLGLEQIWNALQQAHSRASIRFLHFKSRPSICFDYIPSYRTWSIFRSSTLNSKLNVGVYHLKYPTTWLGISFFTFLQAADLIKGDTKPKNEHVDVRILIFEADDLFDQYKYSEVVELLQNLEDSDNADILWRLCRALYYRSKEEKGNTSRDLIKQSYLLAKRALELDDKNYAVHKWYSVLLDAYAVTQGFKARLQEILNVKHHMMRAMELNPRDATTLYMLGSWCFGVTDLPWYQRKIVVTINGSFPSSSFDEALYYFKKAEETSPRFYSLNLLMLGKTYLKLKNTDEARRYLTLASTYPARSDEDLQANKEAEDLLKHLPS